MEAIGTPTFVAECGTRLQVGDRAYNYYDMKPGVIANHEGWSFEDGWFRFDHDDGTSALLNGQRICSMPFARLRGFPGADPA